MSVEIEKAKNDRMRKKSGNITDTSRVVRFLYLLLRDKAIVSDIEEIVSKCEDDMTLNQYTNGWLALYAKDLAQRLNA